jgi:Rieske Fe-S protein
MHATRRCMLAGMGLAGLAGALTACGSGGSPPTATLGAAAAGGGSGAGPGSGSGGGALGATNEIPIGGGKIFNTAKVVVTQPTAGSYKAFSAICTHMQCTVDQVSNGTIDCPCHGSEFSITDGHVVAGPAPSPLPGKSIDIRNGTIVLA